MPAEGFWHSLAHWESHNHYRKQCDKSRDHGTWIKQAALLTFMQRKDNVQLWNFSAFFKLLLTTSNGQNRKMALDKVCEMLHMVMLLKLFLSQERWNLKVTLFRWISIIWQDNCFQKEKCCNMGKWFFKGSKCFSHVLLMFRITQ